MSLRSPASLPGSHTVLSVTALLSPLGCAVSQTPLLCHDLDSFGEDRTGVVSNVPLVGYVCYVSSWSEGLVASGKDTPEVRWPSRLILSGSRRPGHLVRVVPAGCPSCLAGRQPLTEAVSPQGWGRSCASQGVGGTAGKSRWIIWNSGGRISLPHVLTFISRPLPSAGTLDVCPVLGVPSSTALFCCSHCPGLGRWGPFHSFWGHRLTLWHSRVLQVRLVHPPQA